MFITDVGIGVDMKVLLNNSVYEMSRKQFRGVLSVAKKAVKQGIYAVEKGGMAQMKKETYSNKAELEKAVSEYKEKGFKVYYNEQGGARL